MSFKDTYNRAPNELGIEYKTQESRVILRVQNGVFSSEVRAWEVSKGKSKGLLRVGVTPG